MEPRSAKWAIFWQFIVSVGALAVATVLTMALWNVVFAHVPFTAYFVAVAVVAWQAGSIAGMAVGVAGVLIVLITQGFDPKLLLPSLFLLVASAVISMLSASRERADMRLRQTKARNAAILDVAIDGIVSIDANGAIIEWNPAAERMFGYSSSEAIGKEMAELIVPEQYREGHRRGMAQYLTTGHGAILDKRLEMTGLRKDRSEFPMELAITRLPVPGPPVFTGHLRDISQQKRNEAAAYEGEEKFRQLAETIPQLAWMATRDGSIFWYNHRWYDYTGTSEEQMAGWGWQSVHDPSKLPEVMEKWKRTLSTGEPFEMEFPLRAANGTFRWFLTRIAPFRDAQGEILLWFGTNTDIEDQRRLVEQREQILESERAARAEAERTSRMKDEFLATLSHELRTPLNAILGWSQILASEKCNEKDLANGLKTIERNARAQTQIIDDLLDMSRIISGKIRLDVQRVELSPIVQAAIETIKPAADAKGIRIQAVLDPLAPLVSGDPARLQQIFWNLLSNAIKFTSRGGRVQVLLERVNSHVEISVIDTGEGISPDFLPFVFDRFRQADATTTRKHGGLGLGLAIVKQLTELHGGSVRVKSGGAGMGSTFIISLPLTVLHPEPDSLVERRHPSSGGPPGGTETCLKIAGIKVLVVDDEADSRALVKQLLEDCDASVITAESAAEAFDKLRSNLPDLLISDIGMPGEDGYSLIHRIRKLKAEEGGNIPAIALTAYARSEDRTRSVLAGYQMHLSKPVESAELIASVASLTVNAKRN
ncbi:MAG TPA: PAS domain S-box protein [Tepidisphaeraceae bacterium]|nr:PAS domain S-box protein [Tepidisphaeraceae bacterium]